MHNLAGVASVLAAASPVTVNSSQLVNPNLVGGVSGPTTGAARPYVAPELIWRSDRQTASSAGGKPIFPKGGSAGQSTHSLVLPLELMNNH